MRAVVRRRVAAFCLALAGAFSPAQAGPPADKPSPKVGEFRVSKVRQMVPTPAAGLQEAPKGRQYRSSESLILSTEFENVPFRRDDAGTHYHVAWRAKVTGKDGTVVCQHNSLHTPTVAQPLDKFPYTCQLGLSNFLPGRYTLTFELTDVPSGRSATGSITFSVDESAEIALAAPSK